MITNLLFGSSFERVNTNKDGRARRLCTIHPERVAARTLPGGAADLRQDLPDQEADSGADRGSRQVTGMSACDVCAFRPSCFERRGRCASFITEKQQRKEVRKAIERINQSQKPAAGSGSDEAVHEHRVPGVLRRLHSQEADEYRECDESAEGDHSAVQAQEPAIEE